MALPVIIVDSATGTDGNSGAGPGDGTTSGTVKTGTLASTDVAGTTVTLDALTDLTGVATDGSHVIYIADTTAGHRRFSKITGSAGSGGATPTVTVAHAFTGSLSGKTWAIGGKLASVGSASSKLLVDNNTAAGDGKPGWVVEMLSGHAESISAAIDLRVAGDTTTGAMILRGRAGAATLPKITATSAINMIVPRAAYWILRNFELTAGAASMTSAIADVGGSLTWVDRVKLSRTSTNTFTTGISAGHITGCEIQRCATGISLADAGEVWNCYIHDCTSHGINPGANSLGPVIVGNVIAACGGDGINWAFTGSNNRSGLVAFNTIDSCTGDGIEFSGAVGDGYGNLRIVNNILSNNGGYGLKFSNASVTNGYLLGENPLVAGNNTYNNTSGAYFDASGSYAYNACSWASGDAGANPSYTNTAGGDYSVSTGVKAQGYPLAGSQYVGTTSTTYSYADPGAAQRQEPDVPIGHQAC